MKTHNFPIYTIELDKARLITIYIIHADDTAMVGADAELMQFRLSALELRVEPVGFRLNRAKSCKMIGTIDIRSKLPEERAR